jgi:hypothetical protein
MWVCIVVVGHQLSDIVVVGHQLSDRRGLGKSFGLSLIQGLWDTYSSLDPCFHCLDISSLYRLWIKEKAYRYGGTCEYIE